MSPTQHEKDDEPDMYFNTDGNIVFTGSYLLGRGYCCGNGCKHCPYDYKNVPQPRRDLLLAKRKAREEGS